MYVIFLPSFMALICEKPYKGKHVMFANDLNSIKSALGLQHYIKAVLKVLPVLYFNVQLQKKKNETLIRMLSISCYISYIMLYFIQVYHPPLTRALEYSTVITLQQTERVFCLTMCKYQFKQVKQRITMPSTQNNIKI